MKYIAILSTLGSLASAGIVEARAPQASPDTQVSTPARNDTVLYENLVKVNIMFSHFMCDQLVSILSSRYASKPLAKDKERANTATVDSISGRGNLHVWS